MAQAQSLGNPRSALYRGLERRNRVVTVLRWVVPAAGVVLLLMIVGQMLIDSLSQQFGFSNIRIDRNNLVVESPQLTATGEDGTLYGLTAAEAKVSIVDASLIDMRNAVFVMTPPTGVRTEATAEAASFKTDSQQVDVPGAVTIASSDGMSGTLTEVKANLEAFSMEANGDILLTMPDGSTVTADRMTYDMPAKLFVFERATLVLPETPGAATP